MARSAYGMVTACGREWTWESIDDQLRGANWGGSYAHDETERQAYIRAACPTPSTPGTGSGPVPGSPDVLEQVKTWITAHPLETVAVVAAVLLLKK